uniref:C-type lectin domain-containing protein n=1 Tax=Meloidogyne hapla TaxID=6305 RepID=A0A1I8BD43_MELHA
MFPNWALLLPLFGLVAFCRAQNSNNQCNPFICGNDWQNRTEPNDGKVYGYKVFLKSALNFFEAQRICRDQCAEVASVLNDDEYDFVLQVAGDLLEQCQTNASVCPIRDPNPEFNRILNGFWLGMHRVQQYTPYFANGPVDSEIVCMNSDRTNCSFGTYNGTIGEHEDIGLPWVTATPNGGNTGKIITDKIAKIIF